MTRLRKTYRVKIANPATGERETVDLVRDLGIDIPTDAPFEQDTFHAIAWLDPYVLEAYFARRK